MDLLSQAYATPSDSGDDDDDSNVRKGTENWNALPPPLKRTRPETSIANRIPRPVCRYPNPPPEAPVPVYRYPDPSPVAQMPVYLYPNPPSEAQMPVYRYPNPPPEAQMPVYRYPNPPPEAPMPGRYISKRQRAALSANSTGNDDNRTSLDVPSVVGSILDSDIPHGILKMLRHRIKGGALPNQTREPLSAVLDGHTKSVNVLQWSRTHSHLLASAGMDHTIRIWNVWSSGKKLARILNCHSAAVKDVKWSQKGLSLLSCGYDCTSRLVDVEKGMEAQVFKEDQIVEVVKFRPDNYNLFLSGGSKGHLRLWDIRTGMVVHEYIRNLGPILDVEFTIDGKHLITSSDVSKTNLSENSIIVWDVSRQVPLSNQIYAEAYTCPCIRCHPSEQYFIAQSNGNYIAIFSSSPPFKLDKYKRYEGHGVHGFPIKCNFSLDGKMVASGSSDGCVYFYNSRTSNLLRKVKVFEQACIDVAFHPSLPDVFAACSWLGDVSVFHQEISP